MFQEGQGSPSLISPTALDSSKTQLRTSVVVQRLGLRAPTAGGLGSIPGRGTKIPYATRQLSPHATTREKPVRHNERSRVPQLRPDAAINK